VTATIPPIHKRGDSGVPEVKSPVTPRLLAALAELAAAEAALKKRQAPPEGEPAAELIRGDEGGGNARRAVNAGPLGRREESGDERGGEGEKGGRALSQMRARPAGRSSLSNSGEHCREGHGNRGKG
jgi:hypothetical protein